jgi:regulator of replication initiation timing
VAKLKEENDSLLRENMELREKLTASRRIEKHVLYKAVPTIPSSFKF